MIKLLEAIEETNKTVTDALDRASPGLNEMTSHLTQAMGKGVRTILLLNSAMNAEGYVPENAVKAAAAIELLHMATLVHDDVIDDAPLRRGIETVQQKFGKKKAVICGDYLLCMSISMLAEMEQTEDASKHTHLAMRFTRALSGICRGEYKQYQNNGNIDLDIYTYLKIISGKTAALFYISAYSGGLIGGEDEKKARSIGRFGQYLGIVFQIIDDCKDYEFNEKTALKSVGSDIAGGVVTLPLIMAIKKEPSLRDIAYEAMNSGFGVPNLIGQVCQFGGTDDARQIARRYEAKAIQALENIDGVKKENLLALLQKALGASTQF